MKIVLTPTPPDTTTYTGDPREWEDGLYYSDYMRILVSLGQAIRFNEVPDKVWFVCTSYTDRTYRKVPGYTGGISSITPEREGE